MTRRGVAVLGGAATLRLYEPALAALGLNVTGSWADEPLLAVVAGGSDPQVVRVALASGRRVLLGADALAALLSSGPAEDRGSPLQPVAAASGDSPAPAGIQGDWLPALPLPLAEEVIAASERLATGELGIPRLVHVVTYFGVPAPYAWEVDAPVAATSFEAAVWGLDLAEQLLRQQVSTTRWDLPLRQREAALALHLLANGVAVSHEVRPTASGPGPCFQASVVCDRGELLLRAPFAPGAMAIWTADPPGFHAPALPREKPNVQAPDSTPGGWETRRLLEALVAETIPAHLSRREDAVRLVRHITASARTMEHSIEK